MPRRPRVTTAFAGLAALTAACADQAIAPVPPRSYGLATIGGAPVPALVVATAAESTYVLRDVIVLDQFGRAARTTAVQRVWQGVRLPPEQRTDTLRYEESAGHIVIGVFQHCGPGAACPHGDEGTITAERLVLTPQVGPPQPSWEYVRLRPID